MIFRATFPLFEEIVKEYKESHIFFTGRNLICKEVLRLYLLRMNLARIKLRKFIVVWVCLIALVPC